MIINWIDSINRIKNNDDEKENLVSLMEKDVYSILDSAWKFDTVIIKMIEGVRIEISPLYKQGFLDIKSMSKDFNTRLEHKKLISDLKDTEEKLLDSVKNEPDKLEKVQEYLKLVKQNFWLYSIKLIKTENNISKPVNTINDTPLVALKAYILGILEGYGVLLPNLKKEMNKREF